MHHKEISHDNPHLVININFQKHSHKGGILLTNSLGSSPLVSWNLMSWLLTIIFVLANLKIIWTSKVKGKTMIYCFASDESQSQGRSCCWDKQKSLCRNSVYHLRWSENVNSWFLFLIWRCEVVEDVIDTSYCPVLANWCIYDVDGPCQEVVLT